MPKSGHEETLLKDRPQVLTLSSSAAQRLDRGMVLRSSLTGGRVEGEP